MKLEREISTYKLPESVEPGSVKMGVWNNDPNLHPNAVLYSLERVTEIEMFNISQGRVLGQPACFTITGPWATEVKVYPTPDKDYVAFFEYNPARKQF